MIEKPHGPYHNPRLPRAGLVGTRGDQRHPRVLCSDIASHEAQHFGDVDVRGDVLSGYDAKMIFLRSLVCGLVSLWAILVINFNFFETDWRIVVLSEGVRKERPVGINSIQMYT